MSMLTAHYTRQHYTMMAAFIKDFPWTTLSQQCMAIRYWDRVFSINPSFNPEKFEAACIDTRVQNEES